MPVEPAKYVHNSFRHLLLEPSDPSRQSWKMLHLQHRDSSCPVDVVALNLEALVAVGEICA